MINKFVLPEGPQNIETLHAPIRLRSCENVPAALFVFVPTMSPDATVEIPEIDIEIMEFVNTHAMPAELRQQVTSWLKSVPKPIF